MATAGTQERFHLLLVQDLSSWVELEKFLSKIRGLLDKSQRENKKITIEVWEETPKKEK